MPTRTRPVWMPRDDDQFDCRVGSKANGEGKRELPWFRLGADLKAAQCRDHVLRLMREKQFSVDEISGVYLCHGKPLASADLPDGHMTRPFGKLFTTPREVEEHLALVIDERDAGLFGA